MLDLYYQRSVGFDSRRNSKCQARSYVWLTVNELVHWLANWLVGSLVSKSLSQVSGWFGW